MVKKNILFSALNWGLGHASRSIPLIRELANHSGYTLYLAADGEAYQLLKKEFPELTIFQIPDVTIRYLKGKMLPYGLALKFFSIHRTNQKEHQLVDAIVKKHAIELIISDNRYGIWHPTTKNILITHQLTVLPPSPFGFLQPLASWVIRRKLSPFDEIWVPDLPEYPGLAGKLSHQPQQHPNIQYIGLLSRYALENNSSKGSTAGITAIVSGPMPFRQLLIDKISEVSRQSGLKITLFCSTNSSSRHPNLDIRTNASTEEINSRVNGSELVICSGGYTSLMDLCCWQKKAIIIPTPGQTEQAYLAELHRHHPQFQILPFEKLETLADEIEALAKRPFLTNGDETKNDRSKIIEGIFR